MPKKPLNLSETIMSRINREKISIKPTWYFMIGSLAIIAGIICSAIVSAFLFSLVSFSLRTHGPMGTIRYQQLVSSFPWWATIIALAGLGIGIWLLHTYDFSYKKNFVSIVLVFIAAVVLSGWLMDSFGMDFVWASQKPFRRIYEQYDGGWRGGSGKRENQNNQMYRGNLHGNGRYFNQNQ